MKKILSFSVGLILISNYLSAQNFTATASGNWSNPATWGSATYPGAATGTLIVTIPTGFAVTLDVSPAFPIGSLAIAVGNGNNTLTVSAGQTLNVTGGIAIFGAVTGGGGVTKSLIMNGVGAVVNAASLTLTPGNAADKQANVVFNGGGTINISGNVAGGTAANAPITQINFNGGGTLAVGGNITGTQISVIGAAATSTISVTGIASTVGNLIMNGAAASILQLNANTTVAGALTLTAGKINIGSNTLTLSNATPAAQIVGGSATSYVYTILPTGRLVRQNLAAATNYTFPVGTPTDYMPVIVNTAAGVSNFAVSVYSPAAVDAAVGGLAYTDKSRIVDAMWFIDRLIGSGNSALTLQWVTALEGATFTTLGNTQIGISRHNGISWSFPPIQTSGNNTTNIVTASFSAFGVFAVADIGLVLPVKFGAIKAYEKQNGIQLDWRVYSENKVKSYEIERSADGRSYTSVGSLPALYNNTSDGDYGFFDANPLSGTSYYRIKNNDLDGKSAYSIVVRVNRNKTIKGLSLYPNPVVNGIVLLQGSDLGRGNYKINIFGANGQEIYKQQIKHNGGTISHTIELPPTISKGVYMLSVKDENGNIIFKEKLVNQ
ncbi:MAG TPA: T9SS type A sorting domain-containing protein [Chitinophagaceae bacterium]|nr:T9SS type A sorting domain-containing protein [Chitinophagaceae bacterium]